MRFGWMMVAAAAMLSLPTTANAVTIDFETPVFTVPSGFSDYNVSRFVFTLPVGSLSTSGYFKPDLPTPAATSPSTFFVQGIGIRFQAISVDVINTGASAQTIGFNSSAFVVAPGTTTLALDGIASFRRLDLFGVAGPIPPNPTVFFDNVVISNFSPASIPEPATWAMMIAGFGVIGGSLRSAARHRSLNPRLR